MRHLSLILAALLVCASGCSEDETGIVLTVRVAPEIEVHQVLVNARTDGGARMLFTRLSPEQPDGPVDQQVFAIADDGDLNGTPVDFEVLGMQDDGAHIATAFAAASFARGRVVRISVTLGAGDDRCGDRSCDGEDCSSCPEDCGPCSDTCGNGECEPQLNECMECAADCQGDTNCGSCGDGTCRPELGECTDCPGDCAGEPACQECGNGTCETEAGECDSCPQDCDQEPECPCAHDVCETGGPLTRFCEGNVCVRSVCTMFPPCCEDEWSDACRIAAAMLCDISNCACGDGTCSPVAGESCETCDEDCGLCGEVDAGASILVDASLENCGDGTCQLADGEDCVNCPGDCTQPCPPEMGLCSFCPGPGEMAFCQTCGAACGDGSCNFAAGESCESCPADCGPCPPGCGNGVCDLEETCATCNVDCSPCGDCGDGTCSVGETCWVCPEDCSAVCAGGTCSNCPSPVAAPVCDTCTTCGDGTCVASAGETCGTCPADCGGCSCGDVCSVGGPSAPGCGACEAAVCALDASCCLFSWDTRCVTIATALCGGC